MIDLIREHKDALFALCRRYGVRRLDVFGSAARGTFDPDTSDLDVVVEFIDDGPGIAMRFHGFATDAEALFGRPVDLVFDSEMKNPYFRTMVNATREPLYDADRDREAAASCVERLGRGGGPGPGESCATYWSNRVLQLAVERLLGIVGEARGKAVQSDRSLEKSIPEAPLIAGMRHRLIHGYDNVRADIVWDVAQHHVPALRDKLRALLDSGDARQSF